jgi:hypothetical protein
LTFPGYRAAEVIRATPRELRAELIAVLAAARPALIK